MTIKEFKKIVNNFGNASTEEDLFLIVDKDNAEDFEKWLAMYTNTSDGLWLTYSIGQAYNNANWVIRLSC